MRRVEGERPSPGEGALPHASLSLEGGGTASQRGPSRSQRAPLAPYTEAKRLNDGDTRAIRRTTAAYGAVVDGFLELFGERRADEVTRGVVASDRAALAELPAKGEGTRGLPQAANAGSPIGAPIALRRALTHV